ncbi:MAG: response regulator [Acidobacteriota bacterium]|nr:response regulator [Acidobacteriota bacterium]
MKKYKILIVEDESIIALDIKNILEKLEYAVCGITYTGEDAINETNRHRPDLVLMDIGLKGNIDGLAAAEIIFEEFQTPIIFLTGFADDKTIQKAYKSSPFGYIIKPIDEETLKTVIEKTLEKIPNTL